MKFKFQLESVLHLRNHALDSEKNKLAEVVKKLQSLQDLKEEALQRALNLQQLRDSLLFLKPKTEQNIQQSILKEKSFVERLNKEIEQQHIKISQQKYQLVLADREVKKLDKLKEIAREEFEAEEYFAEQVVQNEVATNLYLKHRML